MKQLYLKIWHILFQLITAVISEIRKLLIIKKRGQ